MRLSLLTIMAAFCFCASVAGCSGSGANTVNEPKEVKTIEQQMEEDKTRAAEEAAEVREQAQYN